MLPGLPELQGALDALIPADSAVASAPVVLLAAGVVIFLGVAGEAFFKRTGIPDVALLMGLGVVLGPVLGVVRTEAVVQVVPYFAGVALIIIMFDGGLGLDLRHMARTAHYAVGLALIGFAASVAIVAAAAHYGAGWDWPGSVLLGAMVGGSSSAIVFGLVRNMQISDGTRSMLSFESAITDILATVLAFILFGVVLTGEFSLAGTGETVGRALAVGTALGLGAGIPWLYVTSRMGRAQHGYMLTLGMLFVLFFAANALGESGALTALVFGLMLGNRDRIRRLLRFRARLIEPDDPMHSQLTFLVRSFFFVFVGLLASFGRPEYVALGVAATGAAWAARLGIVRAVLGRRLPALDRRVTAVMVPRGLAAAVLATIPLTMGLPNAEAYPQVVFFVILASVAVTTAGLASARRIRPHEQGGGYVKGPPGAARGPGTP